MRKRILAAFLAFVLVYSASASELGEATSADPETEEPAPAVALTFDDGPNGACTRRLLQILEREDVPATFFVCGYRIVEMPDVVAEVAAAGHEIGLHGYSHDYFTRMSPEKLRQELEQTQALIAQAGGCATLLRPPGGLKDENTMRVSTQMGLPVILWNVDPEDWRGIGVDLIDHRVLEATKPGSIILLHDLYGNSVTAAERIIQQLKAQGYEFLTVSQLAKRYGHSLEPGHAYRCFTAG